MNLECERRQATPCSQQYLRQLHVLAPSPTQGSKLKKPLGRGDQLEKFSCQMEIF